jgi:hypothetical protein
MESNKQEKSNLLKDNPVAKMASGGSWLSKHVSPISMGYSMAPKMEKGSVAYMKGEVKPDYPDIDGDGDKKESMVQAAKDKKNK